MLEAKAAGVDVAHGLPGNAPSPTGSEVKLEEYQVPWDSSWSVCFLGGIQQEMLLDWVEKEVFCLEEKVGQHWDRKQG